MQPPPAGTALLGQWLSSFQHGAHDCVDPAFPFWGFNAVHVCLIPVDPTRPPSPYGGMVLVWDNSNSIPACGVLGAHPTLQPGDYGQRWAIVDPETRTVVRKGLFVIPAADAPQSASGQGPGLQGLFCFGHCWMRDGRLFVAGGDDWTQNVHPTNPQQFGGSALICIFDPWDAPNHWSVLKDTVAPNAAIPLQVRRWYPTCIRLADANDTVLVVGGVETWDFGTNAVNSAELAHETYEAFRTHFGGGSTQIVRETATGGITVGAGRTLPANTYPGLYPGPTLANSTESFFYYPRMQLASRQALGGPTGNVGADGYLWTIGMPSESTWRDHYWSTTYATPRPAIPLPAGVLPMLEEAATVLHPNSPGLLRDVLVVMGGSEGGSHLPASITDKVWLLDTKVAHLGIGWQAGPTMKYRRKFHKAVVLPDTSVLVIGGGQNPGHGGPGDEVFWPEVYRNGQWHYCAKEGDYIADENQNLSWIDSPRTYHSCGLLLPSGRVLSCGGDTRAMDYQVFEPHYFHSIDDPTYVAPRWGTAPPPQTLLGYGASFQFSSVTQPGEAIEKVVLTSPGSWTHAQDPGQRCVVLTFTQNQNVITATAPAHRSEAPPGLYMLWMVSNWGVPSAATWVKLQ